MAMARERTRARERERERETGKAMKRVSEMAQQSGAKECDSKCGGAQEGEGGGDR